MLAEYTKNSPYSQLILQGMVYKLFFYMYENHIPSENDEHTLYIKRFDKRIHDALIYIDSNLEHGSAIEEVASYVSLSPSHFSRLFKSVTGSSYTDYLTPVLTLFVIKHISGGNLLDWFIQKLTLCKDQMNVIIGLSLVMMQC